MTGVLGLDIGGANIKAADQTGRAISQPFAVWQNPKGLKNELVSILHAFPGTDQVASTMTAELADCFSTKAAGVCFILDALEAAFSESRSVRGSGGTADAGAGGSKIKVWSTAGQFVRVEEARSSVGQVAAANWHALATWCGMLVPSGQSLLIDIGTTTTDIIPLVSGRPVPNGLTDVARLQSGELSYTGVWRTPLCAVAHSVPFRDGYCSLAAELFATTLDIYLILEQIEEDEQNLDTANGRPATISAAYDRIARMLCCDRNELAWEEAVAIARFLADVHRQRLAGALERVSSRFSGDCDGVIVSGSGSFLARQLANQNRRTTRAKIIALSDTLSPAIAEAACAYAVAQLAKS